MCIKIKMATGWFLFMKTSVQAISKWYISNYLALHYKILPFEKDISFSWNVSFSEFGDKPYCCRRLFSRKKYNRKIKNNLLRRDLRECSIRSILKDRKNLTARPLIFQISNNEFFHRDLSRDLYLDICTFFTGRIINSTL